jgi:HEAT repeat protein
VGQAGEAAGLKEPDVLTHLMSSPNNEAKTVAAIERRVRLGADVGQRRAILRLAEATSSAKVRNAAALAMADLRIDGAGQVLLRLLGRDDTSGHRGTLLYALEELGEKVPLPMLSHLLLDGRYECREQALDLLGKEQVVYTATELIEAIGALRALAASDDDYAASVGKTAVRWLKSLRRKRT